jgi:multidrug transporter EmrE-like cation transporter
MKIIYGMLFGVIAQILTFIQLQGNIKYNWYQKYPVIVLAVAVPISWLFIKSVEHLVKAYNGEIWPSRLIGFGIGVVVFTVMSHYLFKEPLTPKTLTCLGLGVCIILIQLIWK